MNSKRFVIKLDKKSIGLIITALAVLCLFCPIINYFFANTVGGYAICALYLLGAFSLLLTQFARTDIRNRSFLWFFFFVVIYSSLAIISSVVSLLYGIVFYASIGLLSYAALRDDNNHRLFKTIYYVSFLAFFIAVIMSLPILMQTPGASRILGSTSFEEYGRSYYVSRGLAGFGVTYSLTIFFPILFYRFHINRDQKRRTIILVAILLTAAMVVLSGYTTAMLILIASVLVYIVYRIKKPVIRVLIVIVSIILLLVMREYLSSLLGFVADILPSKAMANHLKELAQLFDKSSMARITDIDRSSLILRSINSFFKSPLIGGYAVGLTNSVGGHSTFFDVLGGFGLICFIPYCAMIISHYKYVRCRLQSNSAKNMWTVSSILFVFLQMVNPVISNYEIVFTYMCVVPCTLFLSERSINSDNSRS